ncbi:aldo/keto reductase family oxidoreductase [Glaciecola siphonariae]|uniref:Aldo/keto reductase family oxidoreductase n=1 Tax=Glaciecola siphonariae TaxID=521012 RepID=A0ABV9M176_9ALTE
MQALPVHEYFPDASRLIFGTMNLGGGWNQNPLCADDIKQAHALLESCIEHGINTIDLADIYTHGKAELVIGKVFAQNKALKQHFIVQSKVGIRLPPSVSLPHYDLSGRWVTEAVHASLKRLGLDSLDVLFLHRPDPLMKVEELAQVLNNLHAQDKFDCLAVSNMHAGQMAYIQSHVQMPIMCNQLELSLLHSDFIEDGMTTNMHDNAQLGFPRGTLEFCMQQKVQLQAWGALAQGQFDDLEAQDANIRNTAGIIAALSEQYGCPSSAIVLAWLMKHPAQIQPVVGTTKPERLAAAAQANTVDLSTEHWYQILEARRGRHVP